MTDALEYIDAPRLHLTREKILKHLRSVTDAEDRIGRRAQLALVDEMLSWLNPELTDEELIQDGPRPTKTKVLPFLMPVIATREKA